MNFGLLWEFLEGLSFHRGVWLFLPAFALHVLEEAPQFTAWANRYASPCFTRADFLRNNGLGMALSALLCGNCPVNERLATSVSLGVFLDGRTPPCDNVIPSVSGPGASGSTPGSGLGYRSTLFAASGN